MRIARTASAGLLLALSACAAQNQEDCRAEAARHQGPPATIEALIAKCVADFPGRRQKDGTYAYLDPKTQQLIPVSGPTLSSADTALIAAARTAWTLRIAEEARIAALAEARRQIGNAAAMSEAQRAASTRSVDVSGATAARTADDAAAAASDAARAAQDAARQAVEAARQR